MRITGILMVMVLVGSLAGCEKLKEFKESAEKAVGQVTNQVKQASDPVQQMLGAYATGYNEVLGSFEDVVDNYSRAIPLDKEPSAELGRINFFGSGNSDMALKTIKEAFAEAASASPEKYKYLQPLANELYGSCEELATIYGDARAYYRAEDFKDDDYARGRELHGKMRLANERFNKAMGQMGAALGAEEDKQMEAELADYDDKDSYGFQFRQAHFKAKQVLNVIDAANSDIAAIDKAVDDFLASTKDLKAFADAKADLHVSFKSYVDQVEGFAGAIKRYRREIKAEEVDPDKLLREHKAVFSAYNTIVSLRNSLAELERGGIL
jgi:hypothetical protein